MSKQVLSNTVRALLSQTSTPRVKVSDALGKKPQGLADQLARGSFNGLDLIKVAQACGCRLAFVDDNSKVLVPFPAPSKNDNKTE